MIDRLDSNRRFLDNPYRLLSQERGLYARIQVKARMNTGFAKSTGNKIRAFLEVHFVLLFLYPWPVNIAVAQSSGTFTATGSMTTARSGHTATLLNNGMVLIAGGGSAGVGGSPPPVLASAELYDPSTGRFTATGNMTTARQLHTATLLPDGKVLIAGGYPNFRIDSMLASAELYDPSTGMFTATGDMITATPCPTATLLGNGKVLIAGDIAGPPPYTAELYDPATGTFAATGTYASTNVTADNNTNLCSTATLLNNGKVLVTRSNLNSAELYDPSTGTFTTTGEIIKWAVGTTTLLMNGKVLVAGGVSGDDLRRSLRAELYDPASGTFISTGDMAWGHYAHTATLLPDGKILIAGGGGVSCITNDGCGVIGILASGELYNPATGAFSTTGDMATPRYHHTASLLSDGTVLMSGGDSVSGTLASAEIYHPAAVQGAPTVRIVDNTTGSQTTLAVGDSFSFQVAGAPPISLVSVSEPGWSGSVGYTGASGLFWLNGIVGSDVVGTWQQTWTIGGVVAQPSPLQFTITPKP